MSRSTAPLTDTAISRARSDLAARTTQLSALMHVLTGDGFDNFKTYNDEIQHNVLWLVSDLSQQVEELSHMVLCDNAAGAS